MKDCVHSGDDGGCVSKAGSCAGPAAIDYAHSSSSSSIGAGSPNLEQVFKPEVRATGQRQQEPQQIETPVTHKSLQSAQEAPKLPEQDAYRRFAVAGSKRTPSDSYDNGKGKIDNNNNDSDRNQDERNLDSGYAWIILVVMFLLSSSVGGASRVYGLVYAKQVAIGYYDHEQASWPIATASTIENLAGILTPALARFLSWRQIQLFSTSLFILANLGAHFSGSLLIDILCLGLIQGLALSINTVLALAINNDYFERYRTTAYGLIMSGSTCGTFVMGPVISWILESNKNFRFAYLAIAAFFGLNIVLALFIVPREEAPIWDLCCCCSAWWTSKSPLAVAATFTAKGEREAKGKASAQIGMAEGKMIEIPLSDETRNNHKGSLSQRTNRKVSQLASHFERKDSIASISVQCGLSRQSSWSRNSSDWHTTISRRTSPKNCTVVGVASLRNESNLIACSISSQVDGSNSGAAAAAGRRANAKMSVYSMRASHLYNNSNATSKSAASSSNNDNNNVSANSFDVARDRALVCVTSDGTLAHHVRSASNNISGQQQIKQNYSAKPEGGEEERKQKKSVISFRAPTVAYDHHHHHHQQQPTKTLLVDSLECSQSLAATEIVSQTDWHNHQHHHHQFTCAASGALSTTSTLTSGQHLRAYQFSESEQDQEREQLQPTPERFTLTSALSLLKLPYLHCVWIMLSLYYLIARIFIIILTDFADDHGLAMEQSSQLLNFWSLGEIFGRIFLSSFIDLQWLSVKSCIVFTCSALAASIGLMVAIEGIYSVYALCSALVAALVSLEYMLINVLMVEYLGKSRVLACYSLGSLLSSLILFGRPALIGMFRDQLDSYDGLLVLLAGLSFGFALLFGLLEPLLVRRWPKAADAPAASRV